MHGVETEVGGLQREQLRTEIESALLKYFFDHSVVDPR